MSVKIRKIYSTFIGEKKRNAFTLSTQATSNKNKLIGKWKGTYLIRNGGKRDSIYMAIQHVQHDLPNQNNMYIELFGITIISSFFMFTVNI